MNNFQTVRISVLLMITHLDTSVSGVDAFDDFVQIAEPDLGRFVLEVGTHGPQDVRATCH